MIYLPKKVCLIIIHTNTIHILDSSCCHQHQQQRYHNENTKKAIPIMFGHVTTHYQTLKTWIGHDVTHYHNFNALPHSLPQVLHTFSPSLTRRGHNAKPYHNFNVLLHVLPYIFSKFSMVWGYLQRVTTRYYQIFIKMYINIFSKK